MPTGRSERLIGTGRSRGRSAAELSFTAMCAGCVMAAAAGASGARSWLQAQHMTWLTPRVLRAMTIALFVVAFGFSSISVPAVIDQPGCERSAVTVLIGGYRTWPFVALEKRRRSLASQHPPGHAGSRGVRDNPGPRPEHRHRAPSTVVCSAYGCGSDARGLLRRRCIQWKRHSRPTPMLLDHSTRLAGVRSLLLAGSSRFLAFARAAGTAASPIKQPRRQACPRSAFPRDRESTRHPPELSQFGDPDDPGDPARPCL